LRVRKRIFDVLRFGTPMAGGYESMVFVKKQPGRLRDLLQGVHRYNGPTYNFVTLVTFFNVLTSTDPARSNPIFAPRLAPRLRVASACKLGRHLGRNGGGPADSAKRPRA
jgi:hypothetical protein